VSKVLSDEFSFAELHFVPVFAYFLAEKKYVLVMENDGWVLEGIERARKLLLLPLTLQTAARRKLRNKEYIVAMMSID